MLNPRAILRSELAAEPRGTPHRVRPCTVTNSTRSKTIHLIREKRSGHMDLTLPALPESALSICRLIGLLGYGGRSCRLCFCWIFWLVATSSFPCVAEHRKGIRDQSRDVALRHLSTGGKQPSPLQSANSQINAKRKVMLWCAALSTAGSTVAALTPPSVPSSSAGRWLDYSGADFSWCTRSSVTYPPSRADRGDYFYDRRFPRLHAGRGPDPPRHSHRRPTRRPLCSHPR